jgi:hypothetical protein
MSLKFLTNQRQSHNFSRNKLKITKKTTIIITETTTTTIITATTTTASQNLITKQISESGHSRHSLSDLRNRIVESELTFQA